MDIVCFFLAHAAYFPAKPGPNTHLGHPQLPPAQHDSSVNRALPISPAPSPTPTGTSEDQIERFVNIFLGSVWGATLPGWELEELGYEIITFKTVTFSTSLLSILNIIECADLPS